MQEENNLNIYIKQLECKKNLSPEEATRAMGIIMSAGVSDSQRAAFLIALQEKGPTAEEIASFATTIRNMAKQLDLSRLDKGAILADTCGTGGGGVETFNVSTTIMFILAGCGIAIAKHGNRAITSKCGSADVLEQLGVNIKMDTDRAAACLAQAGITFLFAPLYHSAFGNVQKVRREISRPTVFNILGPLVNPAFSSGRRQGLKSVQLLGVNDSKLINKLIGVLKLLGLYRAMVVYGQDREGGIGMDEISILGETRIAELMHTGNIREYKIDPRDFGIKPARPEDLSGGSPVDNAQILRDILSGKEKGPKRDIVLVNAAAGIYLAGKAKDLKRGIKIAGDCLDSGNALKKLESLLECSNAGC